MRKGIDYTGISIVFFCHNGDGEFVMAKRSNACRDENGKWDIGGGGIEFADTVENTLKKEIKEEYGANVIKSEFLGYRDVHRNVGGEKSHWVALDFKVLVNREEVKNMEPHKFDYLKWFTLDDLPRNIHSQLPKFFKLYEDKLIK